jgi:hypothetical protein
MKTNSKIALAAACLVLSFTACKKEEASAPTTPNNNNSTPTVNTTPNFVGAGGVCAAVQTRTSQTVAGIPFTFDVGTGAATFWNTVGTYLDAGSSTLNNESLTKNANNIYSYSPGTSNPSGIDFSSNGGNVTWTFSGNSANSITAINRTISIGFPSVDSINIASTTISHATDFTLQCPSISNSDSVLFIVAGPSASLTFTGGGGSTSHTFRAAEMGTIGTGTGIVEIVPYRFTSFTEGSRVIYYVNETAVTKMVTIN